jgi:hypothetical protein
VYNSDRLSVNRGQISALSGSGKRENAARDGIAPANCEPTYDEREKKHVTDDLVRELLRDLPLQDNKSEALQQVGSRGGPIGLLTCCL